MREGARIPLSSVVFVAASLGAAFLIFLVQPMVGKRILPWFGGVPAVWTLCLTFYQVALFLGYAYAHWLVRGVRPARQPLVHGALLLVALATLPVLPAEGWKPAAGADPSLAVLALLTANVAPSFLALAATGPLVQAWFARSHPGRSPYALYAVSNLGSLLALLSYPLLFEPRLRLSTTGTLWSIGFALCAGAVLACGVWAGRTPAGQDEVPARAPRAASPARVASWLALSGCAVLLLMGITNELCLDAASVPFLWILPLTTYLMSFILAFGFRRGYRRAPTVGFTAAVLALRLLTRLAAQGDGGVAALAASVQVEILLQCALLFGACMLLHGELYRLRPPPETLTRFYLYVSGGGALGGLFAGLAAPRLFDGYHELPLATSLACLLLIAVFWRDPESWIRAGAPRWRRALALALAAIAVADAGNQLLLRPGDVLYQERSFFGVLRVQQVGTGSQGMRQLLHGSTRHGAQPLHAEPPPPTLYFGALSGIGLALSARDPARPLSVGVVGLGIGTLAAYGRPGDRYRFYEIDPSVIRLARDESFFSYLARSAAEIEIVEGDGRIALEREQAAGAAGRFDIFVIDAFSSDAIPVHLLTLEALELYLEAVRPDGLVAFHVTNRHFDLVPVLARLAGEAGLSALAVESGRLPRYMTDLSTWVFLSRDPGRIRGLERFIAERMRRLRLGREAVHAHRPGIGSGPARAWTDDYSDLLAALRPLPIRIR